MMHQGASVDAPLRVHVRARVVVGIRAPAMRTSHVALFCLHAYAHDLRLNQLHGRGSASPRMQGGTNVN